MPRFLEEEALPVVFAITWVRKQHAQGRDAPPAPQVSRGRNGSPSSAMTTSPSSEMAQLTQKSHEIQPANIPEHPSLLSRLTGFKGYIKKTYQTFLDAIPIQPKLKISLDVVTFHRKPD